MSKYQIKKRFEGEAESFAKLVEQNNSILYNAILSNAILSNTGLYNTGLYNTGLSGAKIKITQKDEIIKALKIEVIE